MDWRVYYDLQAMINNAQAEIYLIRQQRYLSFEKMFDRVNAIELFINECVHFQVLLRISNPGVQF